MSDYIIELVGKYGMGKQALVSAEDVDLVIGRRWHMTWRGYIGATGPTGYGVALLHRVIAQPAVGMHVDHINMDKTDNRRSNLRVCTQRQNNKNRAKRNDRKCKGVIPIGNRWRATIFLDGRPRHLGYYGDEESAGRAYDAAARYYFKEFAACNFPNEVTSLSTAEIRRCGEAFFHRSWQRVETP